jgi:hypothetical protein
MWLCARNGGGFVGVVVVLQAKWQILLEMVPEYGAEVGFSGV